MTKDDLQLILESFAVLLVLYLAFFKSYFQEKGKNLATQEDTGKITKIVEETKQQFMHDAEVLKTRLTIHSQSFNSIKTLERNALIELNTKYSEWYNSLITFSLVHYSYDSYIQLETHDRTFAQKHYEYLVANDNVHLYV